MAGKEQWLNPDGLDTLLEELRTKMDLLYAPINSIHKDIDTDSLIEQSVSLAQEYANEKIKSLRFSRPNLLRNWYFGNGCTIDQRNGYIALNGISYYDTPNSDTATVVGTLDKNVTVEYHSAGWYSITINSVEYYISATDVVRGYVNHAKYSIDGYRIFNYDNTASIVINDDCISLTYGNSLANELAQLFPIEIGYMLAGKPLTFSILTKEGDLFYSTMNAPIEESKDYTAAVNGTNNIVFHLINNWSGNTFFVGIRSLYKSITNILNIVAMKLEVGEGQTLAYQDDNGNWILYDNYDSQEQLIKCQKYQFTLNDINAYFVGRTSASTNDTRAFCTVPLPVTPRVAGTATFNGTIRCINLVTGNTVTGKLAGLVKHHNNGVEIHIDIPTGFGSSTPVIIEFVCSKTTPLFLDFNL